MRSSKPILEKVLALDTETTGGSTWRGARPFAVSGCDHNGNLYWWEWVVAPKTRKPDIPKRDIATVASLISKYDKLVFHNASFDIGMLEVVGVWKILGGIPWEKVEDTLPMSHVLDSSSSHELKPLGLLYLDILDTDEKELHAEVHRCRKSLGKSIEVARSKGWNLGDNWRTDFWLPKAINKKSILCKTYGLKDAERTIRLRYFLVEQLKKLKLWNCYKREESLIPVVYKMQRRGVRIDLEKCESELARYSGVAQKHSNRIKSIATQHKLQDFNVGSGPQLQNLLYTKLKLPVVKTTPTGLPSTDAESLEELLLEPRAKKHFGTLQDLLNYRKATSAVTYLHQYRSAAVPSSVLDNIFIIHPSLLQNGTGTTRFSSHDPNAQNISKDADMPLRGIFGPRPGYFWLDYDYSNIEMRIFAYRCNEKALIRVFESGGDKALFHLTMGKRLHGKGLTIDDPRYGSVKNGNFSIIFGASEWKADRTYGVDGAYSKIRGEFPGLAHLFDEVISYARTNGQVETLFGYPLQVPRRKEYVGVNYICQGTAGEVMKRGMVNVDTQIAPQDARLLLTIHDELIIEVPNKHRKNYRLFDQIRDLMEAPGKEIGIPVPVSRYIVTDTWDKKEDLVCT